MKCGIGRSTLSRWECGASQPHLRDLEAVLNVLGLSEHERIPFEPFLKQHKIVDPQATARRRLLRAARLRNGLSLGDAASRVGVSKATLSRWETGDRRPDRTRLAAAAEAVGATSSEICAIANPGNLFEATDKRLETLQVQVRDLRCGIPRGCTRARDLDFIGLDAAIAEDSSPDAKRLRLELRAAYVEWLGWWYRDAEAGGYAAKLLPSLRKEPSSVVWGRLLRACANYATEFRRDPEMGIQLLSDASEALRGVQSEGFVRRELAGLYLNIGDRKAAREELKRARDAGAGEEDLPIHLYCCAMVEATIWSEDGQHDLAIASLPQSEVQDPYLNSSSAIGRSRILIRAGETDRARAIIEASKREADALGLPHFSNSLSKHLQFELL